MSFINDSVAAWLITLAVVASGHHAGAAPAEISAGTICCQDDDPQSAQASKALRFKNLASVRYGKQRTSKQWVEKHQGVLVAVDEGIQYDGTNLYLSLTDDLLLVDQKTGKPLWSATANGNWSELAVESVEPADGKGEPRIVVALRSDRGDDQEARIERYDFKSGKKLPESDPPPRGKMIEPVAQFMGDDCSRDEPMAQIITDRQAWLVLREEFFSSAARELPRDDLFDEKKQVVLVLADGATTNCRGISAEEILQSEAGMVVRLQKHTYQSLGDTPTVRPYGIIVLPKTSSGRYVIETNRQRLKGGPADWKSIHTLQVDER